jgi:hypothetical protein
VCSVSKRRRSRLVIDAAGAAIGSHVDLVLSVRGVIRLQPLADGAGALVRRQRLVQTTHHGQLKPDVVVELREVDLQPGHLGVIVRQPLADRQRLAIGASGFLEVADLVGVQAQLEVRRSKAVDRIAT